MYFCVAMVQTWSDDLAAQAQVQASTCTGKHGTLNEYTEHFSSHFQFFSTSKKYNKL